MKQRFETHCSLAQTPVTISFSFKNFFIARCSSSLLVAGRLARDSNYVQICVFCFTFVGKRAKLDLRPAAQQPEESALSCEQ